METQWKRLVRWNVRLSSPLSSHPFLSSSTFQCFGSKCGMWKCPAPWRKQLPWKGMWCLVIVSWRGMVFASWKTSLCGYRSPQTVRHFWYRYTLQQFESFCWFSQGEPVGKTFCATLLEFFHFNRLVLFGQSLAAFDEKYRLCYCYLLFAAASMVGCFAVLLDCWYPDNWDWYSPKEPKSEGSR